MKRRTMAISAILTIILILVAAIVGALVAYVWTMAPFYLEPENAVDLIITNVNFPLTNAKYFGVTLMNPSHSVTAANISDIYLTAPGFNRTSATITDPSLPIMLERGTTQTFNCSLRWGDMSGEVVTVHVSTGNTEAAYSVPTQSVKLGIDTVFNASQSVNYFDVTVTSADLPINLTLSQVLFDFNQVQNSSITFPEVIQPNATVNFICYVPWQGYVNPLVRVETVEGYGAQTRATANAIVSLQITQVSFNETNTDEIDLTLFNSPDSTNSVNISNITLTYGNNTDVINGSNSTPPLPKTIDINQSAFFACKWNWSDSTYRNVSITVNAYTQQGFVSTSTTKTTPQRVAANITAATFDLGDTGVFSVNATNLPYSLSTVNVTEIDLNGTSVSFNSTVLGAGQQAMIACNYNWSRYVGQNARITAHFNSDFYEFVNYYDAHIPYIKVTGTTFSAYTNDSLYVNVTVHNSEFSGVNATIMDVRVTTNNATLPLASDIGYTINTGSDIAIVCSWNWKPFSTQNIIVTVYCSDGTQASATFQVA